MRVDVVHQWVVDRRLLGTDGVRVIPLDGGVSCEVFSVEDRHGSLIVKHAEPRLRVAADWRADPRRVVHEGEVIKVLARLTPEAVPTLLAIDREHHVIAITKAPHSWVTWKQELAAGRADVGVARTLGRTLGTWHRTTWGREEFAKLDDYPLFEALRLEPYFGHVQTHQPHHQAPLAEVVARLRDRRLCLVHGDFSPKNVLVGEDGTWVLDFEVAHVGDPQFDLAFMLTHLTLKSINRPEFSAAYWACAAAFLKAYTTVAPDAGEVAGPELLRLLGALLLARVHGKSPVTYLDAAGRSRTTQLAESLLYDKLEDLGDLWTQLEGGPSSHPTP